MGANPKPCLRPFFLDDIYGSKGESRECQDPEFSTGTLYCIHDHPSNFDVSGFTGSTNTPRQNVPAGQREKGETLQQREHFLLFGYFCYCHSTGNHTNKVV